MSWEGVSQEEPQDRGHRRGSQEEGNGVTGGPCALTGEPTRPFVRKLCDFRAEVGGPFYREAALET